MSEPRFAMEIKLRRTKPSSALPHTKIVAMPLINTGNKTDLKLLKLSVFKVYKTGAIVHFSYNVY